MAQNEGRTLRRAPKLSLPHFTLFVIMLVMAVAFGMTVHGLKAAAESALTPQVNNPNSTVGTNAGTEPTSSQLRVTSTPNTNLDAVPECTPAHYKLPTSIELSGLATGVTTVEESLQQYTVYGNTADERLQQLQHCAPGGEYAGAASYQVTWQYSYSVRSDGLCQIVQPKIGLHLAMILPHWQPGPSASAEAQAKWNTYIRALTTHEQGHYGISKQYAKTMLSELQDLSPQTCNSIKQTADTLLESKLAQLSAAQENYDAVTDHGATQGATL
jgi:predicted secreted Zn-dependent protease